MIKTRCIWGAAIFCVVVVAGYVFPEHLIIPVEGATTRDWNHETFWYEPWGLSGVHKGIDVFAKRGTPVVSAIHGIVFYQGVLSRGGNVVAVLGPKWRIHYYSHLDSATVRAGTPVSPGSAIGEVGDSGNARGKPPHLHYAIITMIPYPWRWDGSTQGWKKMFFLNPSERLLKRFSQFPGGRNE